MQDSDQRNLNSEEIDILRFFQVIWKRKWFIVFLVLASTLATFLIGSQVPKIYRSVAVLIPSQGSQAGILMTVLKSKALESKVFEEIFPESGLIGESIGSVQNDLGTTVSFKSSGEGAIKIQVEAEDPVIAAKMANAYVETLKTMTQELKFNQASGQRVVIETMLAEAEGELALVEEALKDSLVNNGKLGVAEGTISSIREAAVDHAFFVVQKLKAQWTKQGHRALTWSAPSFSLASLENGEVKAMEDGEFPQSNNERGKNGRASALEKLSLASNLEFRRLVGELERKFFLYQTLSLLYVEVKLLDELNVPTFQILDRAVPNHNPVKPELFTKVMIAFFASLVVGVFLVCFLEYVSRLRVQMESVASKG